MIKLILFDYDSDTLSGRKALKDGLNLIMFAIFKFFKIKPMVNFLMLCDNYAFTIIKLNKMLGIKTIIGIKSNLDKTELINKLTKIDANIDVRMHVHVGVMNDKNKLRLWYPPLNQTKNSWNFEREYCNNGFPKLGANDIPVFHFDNPHHLNNYISFLYNRYIDCNIDYDIVD